MLLALSQYLYSWLTNKPTAMPGERIMHCTELHVTTRVEKEFSVLALVEAGVNGKWNCSNTVVP